MQTSFSASTSRGFPPAPVVRARRTRVLPLHRYFWWAKHIELAFGSAPAHLTKIGSGLAA
jgi:hypothetical protein